MRNFRFFPFLVLTLAFASEIHSQSIEWQQLGSVPRIGPVYDVDVSPTRTLISTDSGIYRSSDDGKTWVLTAKGYPGYSSFRYKLAHLGSIAIAGTYSSGLLRSLDDGVTWTDTI